MNVGLAGL